VALTTSQLSGQFSSHRSPPLVKIPLTATEPKTGGGPLQSYEYCTRIGGVKMLCSKIQIIRIQSVLGPKDIGLFYIAGKFKVLQFNVIYFYLVLG
jgi:hypothetical protein